MSEISVCGYTLYLGSLLIGYYYIVWRMSYVMVTCFRPNSPAVEVPKGFSSRLETCYDRGTVVHLGRNIF